MRSMVEGPLHLARRGSPDPLHHAASRRVLQRDRVPRTRPWAVGGSPKLQHPPRPGEDLMSKDWPLWEVFVRAKGGMAHRHVGSVHAPDPEIALRHARDTYTRRMEGVSLWVVPSAQIVASDPAEDGPLFAP